ncbi:hypothetical protein [Filifactor alocis]
MVEKRVNSKLSVSKQERIVNDVIEEKRNQIVIYQLLRAGKINRLKKTADYFDIGKRERTESYVKDRIETKPIDRV